MRGNDFWSRRRAGVEAETRAEQRQAEATTREIQERSLEEMSDEELLVKFDLPDPETLGQGDDFSVFLKAGVPQRLKKIALRRLWGTNPVLANLDGLVDYGEDYTDAATVAAQLATSYQVGKGMTAHIEKMMQEVHAEGPENTVADEAAKADESVAEEKSVASGEEDVKIVSEDCPEDAPQALAQAEGEDRHGGADFYPRRKKMRYKIYDDKGGAA
ncbi:DUF3306 domain-containing protein [Marimonas sp. MJW-29]|uniref:DUF3306 domain-containing protein n=1 Tax=Sulfitobacter sediminis TaxID=3234186 RepID=A0ABV3RKX2_9RHOB